MTKCCVFTFYFNLLNNKIKYRSKFELSLAKTLTANNIEFQYEEERFEYIPAPRHYTPDFYFPETNIYVEAKGHLDKGDRVKMVLMKKQHPELDIRFVFVVIWGLCLLLRSPLLPPSSSLSPQPPSRNPAHLAWKLTLPSGRIAEAHTECHHCIRCFWDILWCFHRWQLSMPCQL